VRPLVFESRLGNDTWQVRLAFTFNFGQAVLPDAQRVYCQPVVQVGEKLSLRFIEHEEATPRARLVLPGYS
jgi:hypothetical protein